MTKEQLKENNEISEILPLSEIKDKKIYLFYGKDEKVEYCLYTDGNVEHLDTWIDKKPYQLDSFLEGCGEIKRFEFKVNEANLVVLEKKYDNKLVRNLYINLNNLYKAVNSNLYQVSISEKENIKIKRLENVNAN